MDRRTFLHSVASVPFASVIPTVGKNDSENDVQTSVEDQWKLSAWREDIGYLVVIKNGDIEYEWEYEDYENWHSAVRWTARSIFECNYVVDGLRVDLKDIYIDPPFFHSVLRGELAEVRVRQGKYSDSEYRYYVRTENTEGEYGADDFNEMIRDIQDKVIDTVRAGR